MALARRRTTVLLSGIVVVFTIVLIILCFMPEPDRPRYFAQDGEGEVKSPATHPTDIFTGTDPPTTMLPTTTTSSTREPTEASTTTTSSTTKEPTEASTTTISSTREATEASTTDYYHPHVTTSWPETTTKEFDKEITAKTEHTSTPAATTELSKTVSTSRETTEGPLEDTTTESTRVEVTKGLYEDTTTISSSAETTEALIGDTTTDLSERDSTIEKETFDPTTTEETFDPTTTEETFDETTTEGTFDETTTEETFDETTTEGTITETAEKEVDLVTTDVSMSTTMLQETSSMTTEETQTTYTTEMDALDTTSPEEETSAPTTLTETTVETTTMMETTTPLHTTTQEVETTTTIVQRERKEEADQMKLASRMLDMMDHSADPCQDFYEYACGGVTDNRELVPEDPGKDVTLRLIEMLQPNENNDEDSATEQTRNFYNSCLNKPSTLSPDDLATLREQVDKLGTLDPRVLDIASIQDTYSYIDEDRFDLKKMLAEFIKMDYAPFFDVSLDVDKYNIDKFTVRLSLPMSGFDSAFSEPIDTWYCRSQYQDKLADAVKHKKNLQLNDEYYDFVKCKDEGGGHYALVSRLKEAARVLNLTDRILDPNHAIDVLADTSINAEFFLRDIKESWPARHEVRHKIINKNYKEYQVAELDSKDIISNLVNWSELLEAVVGVPVTKVQLYHEGALRDILKRIQEENRNQAKLRNILLLMWSEHLYTELVEPVGVPGTNTPEYCVAVTQHLLPDIAGELYLKSFKPAELKHLRQQVDRVVNSVKKTAAAAVTNQVSRSLENKLQYMVAYIGAATNLEELAGANANAIIDIEINESYIKKAVTLLKRRRRSLYSILNKATDHPMSLWTHFSVPYSTTATTVYAINKIFIPEGVMSPPLLYTKMSAVPDYILFAGIGHMFAHEFLHAMDTTGMKFSSANIDLESEIAVERSEYCLKQILNNNFSVSIEGRAAVSFRLPESYLHLNELMADTGATRLAWLAYQHRDVGSTTNSDTEPAGEEAEYVDYGDPKRRRRRSSSIFIKKAAEELPLPWLREPLSPQQLYLLRTAQTQCSSSSKLDAIALMEHEHLPSKMRVNLALWNEPLFHAAFQCSPDTTMGTSFTCPYPISSMQSPQPPSEGEEDDYALGGFLPYPGQ